MRAGAALLGTLLVIGGLAPLSGRGEAPTPARPVSTSSGAADESLTLAANCLDRGDEAGAVPHLRSYVQAHPDALMVRAHLAELLFRLGETNEARQEFEEFVRSAQPLAGPAKTHLVHVHTRLMELARSSGDDYQAELHRGIGLVLLVKRWDADPARRDERAAEQTLAKAIAALRTAREERPGDPRANLYLAEAYTRLGQASAARSALRAAKAGLPDPALTAAERERLTELSGGDGWR